MNEKPGIGVIILAAGSSSRLGYPKQLVKFKGKSLLQNCIDMAESLKFDPEILVLGARAEKIQKTINLRNFEVVLNETWEEGMGTSISKGISEALLTNKKPEHILILLSDQPFVTGENIQELIKIHLKNNKQATFSKYSGDVGVPAIFSKEIFTILEELKGDQGAKKPIIQHRIEYKTVQFEDGNFDVDTPEDVEKLKQKEAE